MRVSRAAWLAWSLFALTLGLAVLAWALMLRLPAEQRTMSSEEALFALAFACFALVGALVAARRPENPIGWLFIAAGLVLMGAHLSQTYATYALLAAPGLLPGGAYAAWIALWSTSLPNLLTIYAVLLFPHGRLPSDRWRLVAWVPLSILVARSMVMLDPAYLFHHFPTVENPLGVEALRGGFQQEQLWFLVYPFVVLVVVPSVVVRLRNARGVERQQLKWFVYASVFAGLIVSAIALFQVWSLVPLLAIALTAIPTAVGIAILRHRLYDIDLLIRRTLVYATLTASLGLVYWGAVVLLQFALRPVTEGSELAIIGSVLAVAALFQPARHRIQEAVDRRFYRQKYDAQRTLEAFSARLREQTDLDSLTAETLRVVRETVQPTRASLWLRSTEPARPARRTG